MFPRLELSDLWTRAGITLDNFGGGAGGRRSLVVRGISVILILQPKFLNRVRA